MIPTFITAKLFRDKYISEQDITKENISHQPFVDVHDSIHYYLDYPPTCKSEEIIAKLTLWSQYPDLKHDPLVEEAIQELINKDVLSFLLDELDSTYPKQREKWECSDA